MTVVAAGMKWPEQGLGVAVEPHRQVYPLGYKVVAMSQPAETTSATPADPVAPGAAPAAHAAAGVAPAPRFTLEGFAPGWGASVMGTAALAVVGVALAGRGVVPALTRPFGIVVFLFSLVLGVLVIGTATARWIVHPRAALRDLAHPVKGGMSATLPGAVLVLAVAFGRVGALLLPEAAIRPTVLALTAIGGVFALVFGWAFLTGVFARGDTRLGQITGAWFIPPVVAIIVPTALSPFIGVREGDHALDIDLLGISWVMLGIGAALFLAITAILVVRSAIAPLPPAPLAPTLTIGLGPAGLIGLDLLLMARASERMGLMSADAVGLAAMIGGMFWGFGAWWAVSAVIVILRGYDRLPFALSWWGFTFPLAAWTIAGLQISEAVGSAALLAIAVSGAVLLVVVWAVTLVRTIVGVANRSIWAG